MLVGTGEEVVTVVFMLVGTGEEVVTVVFIYIVMQNITSPL
jgi:hypothetical protein